jgi:protein-disulfide isomerase
MQFRNLLLAGLLVPYALAGAAPPKETPDAIVAVVSGREITMREVDQSIEAKLYAIEQQKYALRKAALNNIISALVVSGEAQRRGLPVEKLRAALTEGAAEVTTAEVERAYEEHGAVMQALNADEARERLRLDLQARARMTAFRNEIERLQQAAGVVIRLEEPRLAASADHRAPSMGRAGAPVTLTIFSDFECPYCRTAQDGLRQLRDTYPDDLRIVYKNLPLDNHANAFPAAVAAHCAGEQQRFWEFHDALFASANVSEAVVRDTARAVKLDLPQFERCLGSDVARAAVLHDRDEAARAGINGTPSYVLNGKVLRGAHSPAALREAVQSELALRKPAPAAAAAE